MVTHGWLGPVFLRWTNCSNLIVDSNRSNLRGDLDLFIYQYFIGQGLSSPATYITHCTYIHTYTYIPTKTTSTSFSLDLLTLDEALLITPNSRLFILPAKNGAYGR